MLDSVWARLRGRPVGGIALSLAIHLLVALAIIGVRMPGATYSVKRGEPLFVELPDIDEPAPRGNPAARSTGAPGGPRAVAAAPKPPAPKPAPVRQPPAPTEVVRAPEPPAPPVQRPPAQPTPPPPPAPAAQPAPPAPSTPPAAATPSVAATEPLPSKAPEAPKSTTSPVESSVAARQAPRPSAEQKVAALPPPAREPVDIRSALGRSGGGGAGGTRDGRGGIEGEPIPLDSADPRYNDFLDRVRRQIKANWGYPCIKNDVTKECEFKTASLIVEFGLLKNGKLQFVEVIEPSGLEIYDAYAVNAIKLGSPFPEVPPQMIMAMHQGSTGVTIMARFTYTVTTSLSNLLH